MNDMNKQERLYSLDLLRGLDMFFLTTLAPILFAVHEIWGLPHGVLFQLTHPWEGFTAWDLIMPLFLFMMGAAIPFSLEKRLERNGGKPNGAYWKHVLGRFALLWALGMLVGGHLTSLDILKIHPYNNTLQTIAFGYLVCAATICSPSFKLRIGLPLGCFVVYGILLHAFGDYSMTGNFAEKVEQAVLTAIMPSGSAAIRETGMLWYLPNLTEIGEIHYSWWLTSLMFVFMTFVGYFATKILQLKVAPMKRALYLGLYGVAFFLVGWVLSLFGVKLVKHVFTVSFTAEAMGVSAILLAVLYVLTDIYRFRRGLGVFILFGQFALTAYLLGEYFNPVTGKLAEMLTPGFAHLLGTTRYQPLVLAIACALELIAALMIRRKMKESNRA